MQEEFLVIFRSLKQSIEEIIPPLEAAQLEVYGKDEGTVQNGLDFIMGELTMTVLLLTGTDTDVATRELELLNSMRHVVYGYGIPDLSSSDYLELCREFLRIHPEMRLTIDHLPASMRFLLAYDQTHDTEYASKARELFIQFGEAIVKADNNEHPIETIILENFKDTLNAKRTFNQ
jgi:hypothetical protein